MTATRDPLVEMSERFALGRHRYGATVVAGDPASSVRPFGLLFAAAPQPVTEPDTVGWRLCPDRQILVGRGGADLVDMTQKTTGPSGDGSSGGGAEEWGPDHHDDEDLPA